MKPIAFLPLLVFAACQNSGPAHTAKTPDTLATVARVGTPPAPPDTTTLGGMWYLQPMLPSDTATGKIPTLDLNLDKSRFSGNTGCNKMHGEFWFSKTDSSLSFSDRMNITRMSCPGYDEPAFIKSLRSAGRYRLRNGVLTLLSDNNTELSHWVRKPSTVPKALKA
ncbi:MAG TPA: META domain-containing protein [Puia sp.]|nr:META domain-containing protein [Puia sp.]